MITHTHHYEKGKVSKKVFKDVTTCDTQNTNGYAARV